MEIIWFDYRFVENKEGLKVVDDEKGIELIEKYRKERLFGLRIWSRRLATSSVRIPRSFL